MKEEREFLKNLFYNYLINSKILTSTKYPGSLFYVFDEQIVRDKILDNIVPEEEEHEDEYYFLTIKDKVLFQYDQLNGNFWIESEKVWAEFSTKLSLNYKQTQEFFKELLQDSEKLKNIIPHRRQSKFLMFLNQHDKLKDITPAGWIGSPAIELNDNDTLKEL